LNTARNDQTTGAVPYTKSRGIRVGGPIDKRVGVATFAVAAVVVLVVVLVAARLIVAVAAVLAVAVVVSVVDGAAAGVIAGQWRGQRFLVASSVSSIGMHSC
jgi:hypothetical protein